MVPQFIRLSIDTLTSTEAHNTVWRVVRYMGQMIGVTLIVIIARFGWRHFLSITARKIETELRYDVYARLTTLSHDFYARYSTGDIIARLTNDLRAIRMMCGFAIVSIVDGVVMSMAIVALLLSRYPYLALQILAPLPLISIMVFLSGRVITARYVKVQSAFSALTENARHALSNIRTIKSYGKEHYFGQKFNLCAETYKKRTLSYARFWSLIFPSVLFLATCSHLLLIIFGGRAVIANQITVGDFVAIITYLEMLLWPMVGLGFTINLFAQGTASLKRINELLHASPLIDSPLDAQNIRANVAIDIQQLHYTYPEKHEPTLRNISLTIPATAHMGIIGRTASGKSTFVQLLPRILDPPPNTIFMNGIDVRNYALAQLRKSVCIVTQQSFLFSESIAYNVNFGTDDLMSKGKKFDQIVQAAAISINSVEFPHGLETEIGENGIMISGGQKQRIAIARALLVDPPVIIFDDAFSALDTETEQVVLQNIRTLRQGKCTMFISNRVNSLAHCDVIHVMDEGAIIQSGTYSSLIREKGLFQYLYRLQVPEGVT